MDGIGVAGEVVTAGTALAGLILIYIGTLSTAFGTYQAAEQKTVRLKFVLRAWAGFVGFFLSLFAAGLAVVGKWMNSSCTSNAAVMFLLIAFVWAIFATVQAIREMH